MNRSIIQRLFPQPAGSILPEYEERQLSRSESAASAPRIRMQASRRTSTSPSDSTSQLSRSLRSAPLSASLVHHDDPFLPIERAARVLQENIQSFLDAQSALLGARLTGAGQEDGRSNGSLTPTQSVSTPARRTNGMRTVPIRQPTRRKPTLKSARQGLAKSMREFANLRGEELRILESEENSRDDGIRQAADMEDKREALQAEIESIRREGSAQSASTLREEAQIVANEISELEHRLLELKVRHRHLLGQADQLESSLESKVSSFKGSVSMVDREIKDFLKRPPVKHALSHDSSPTAGMYSLRPERRTLEMAKDQWTQETLVIRQRVTNVEQERRAFLEAERIWSTALERIDTFERQLRNQTKLLMQSAMHETPGTASVDASSMSPSQDVTHDLDGVIHYLEMELAHAETENWNLLICVLGAELEAFHKAREMMSWTPDLDNSNRQVEPYIDMKSESGPGDQGGLPRPGPRSSTGSDHSNQSLRHTLEQFDDGTTKASAVQPLSVRGSEPRYESEDDDPPSDFLFSH